MSKFSDRLKEFIHEDGNNIYALAKRSGVERSGIHRIIKGDRIPSEDFVEKISNGLKLSPSERKELSELYGIAKIRKRSTTS